MPEQDFLYPPVPGITGDRVLTANTAFTAGMRGKVIGLAGFTLTLAALPVSKFGAFYVVGPGNIAGAITGALSAGQAALVVVRGGGFSWGQASVVSVAGKSGAVSLVTADIGGLAAELQQRIRFDASITGLTGGGVGKLDGIPTAAGATPLNTFLRVEVPAIGLLDYRLQAGEVGVEVPGDWLPHIVKPADYHLTANNVAWTLTPASVASQFSVRPALGTNLGGNISLWNSEHTGGIILHAHNCDAGTDAVEFTKAGVVAMLSDVEPLAVAEDVLHLNPGLIHRDNSQLTSVRNGIGITRNADASFAVSPASDIVMSRVLGWSGIDPNATWIPGHLWLNSRPTWRLSGRNFLFMISRTAGGLWEIMVNGALAFRGSTVGKEYPWQETVWNTFNGFSFSGGSPLLEPNAYTPVEFVPPHLLPPERVYPLIDAATITPDFAAAKMFTVTLGGNRTLANPVNVSPGGYLIRVKQDGPGGRALAFGNRFRFSGGVAPVLSDAAGAEDILSIVNFGGNELYVTLNSHLTAVP